MRHIGVIDIGKTNAKFAVVEVGTLREIAVRTQPNTVLDGSPYPHFDIEGIWRFLCGAIAETNAANPIDAISITTHGATAALVGTDGSLVLPVLDYEFDGPDRFSDDYNALRPPYSRSLSPRLPAGLNLGAQLYFQRRCWPDEFKRVAAILTYPQYWAYRLSGVLASERTSLGCHSDLWDFRKDGLSILTDVLDIAEKFPGERSPFDRLGIILPELAAELGLSSNVPIFCGIHDSNASILPHIFSAEPPFSVVSTGTWVIACSPGGSMAGLNEDRDCLANIDALGRAVPSARFMGGREFAALIGGSWKNPSKSAIDRVVDEGLFLMPSIQQGSGPFPHSQPSWTNDSENCDPETRFVIVCFYLALMTAECLSLTGGRGPIIVEGPFASHQIYLDMLRAATDREIRISARSATGTSIGAALLAIGKNYGPDVQFSSVAPRTGISSLKSYAQHWREIISQNTSMPY